MTTVCKTGGSSDISEKFIALCLDAAQKSLKTLSSLILCAGFTKATYFSHPCFLLAMIQTARTATAHRSQVAVQNAAQLSVKVWGVRGSVPTPVATNQRYGGNTVCVEVLIGEQRIIFDGGTGIVGLGHALLQENSPVQAHLFFTHTQWDRIQGFPFFQPAFTDFNHFSIYGGTAPNGASIKHCLTDQMLKPYFSMPLQNMKAELDFHTLTEKDCFQLGDVSVETLCINRRTEAFGYRLTYQDTTLVYATDTPTECIDLEFLKFVEQADILIYDGTYRDLTYLQDAVDNAVDNAVNNRVANEDSTLASMRSHTLEPWDLGLEIAEKAHIKELVLLHHSPMQDDDWLDQLQCDLSDRAPNAKIAYEGMVINR